MKISIALASYNGAKYLQAQLDSFVSQTRHPDELIISDDGSSDATIQIIEQFSKVAPFQVIWWRNERNLGYGGNFNAALMKTSGDLVFLSDQDDVWFPKKIERIVALANANPHAYLLMNDAALTDGELHQVGLTSLGQIRSAAVSQSFFVLGCCVAVRRNLLDLCLPVPDGYPAHDNWLVEIADQLGRKLVIEEVLQYYRRHGDNASQWILNRTKKVTRWHMRMELWRKGFKDLLQPRKTSVTSPSNSISPELILFEWAVKARSRTSDDLVLDLERLLKKMKVRIATINRRGEIRQLRLLRRIQAVIEFWRWGGYPEFSRLKSAIRDIFLP